MRASLASMAFLLAACSEPPAPDASPAAAGAAEAGAAATLEPASPAAEALTGALTIAHDRLEFARGLSLATTPLDASGATAFIERQLQVAPGSREIELRRVDLVAGEADFCGGAPGYVAMAQSGGEVALLMFSGRDPPGPAARSAPCAAFAYR